MHPHTARLAETLADPRVRAREMIVEMEHPPTSRVRILLAKASFVTTQPMAPSDAETLLLDRDGPVATLTINRPDRLNAVTFAMFSRLPALLAEAEKMAGVRVLVLRGAGRKSFSAGADISEFPTARATPQQAAVYDNAVLAAEEALATFPAPTIAAIHGHCYGGGCALALACDLRFASSGARFAITPAKLGIVYPLRATKRLVDAVGPSRAKFILMSGIDIDAARAAAIGLVDEVDDDVDTAVSDFVEILATRSGVTQRAVKQTVARILDGATADDDAQAALRDAALASPDYAEGVRAFLERRPPKFG
jgi:enoyl-CoA hydratase/carnithine racemase